MSSFTNTILCSDKIKFNIQSDNRYVSATKNIDSGELLLLEHAFVAHPNIVTKLVDADATFFNAYYPRTTQWKLESQQSLAHEKVEYNIAQVDDVDGAIGVDFVQFNHACDPVAGFGFKSIFFGRHKIVVICIFAIKPILAGENITIHYGNDVGHIESYPYSCKCLLLKKNRQEIFKTHVSTIKSMLESDIIDKHITKYVNGPKYAPTLLHQTLAKKGLYATSNNLIITTRFIKLMISLGRKLDKNSILRYIASLDKSLKQ